VIWNEFFEIVYCLGKRRQSMIICSGCLKTSDTELNSEATHTMVVYQMNNMYVLMWGFTTLKQTKPSVCTKC